MSASQNPEVMSASRDAESMSASRYTEIVGGITAPRGFLAAGIHCGVKKAKKDLALLVSAVPAVTAATFTTNRVVAAPIIVTRENLEQSHLTRAVVVNSGNANACTGERGLADARLMTHTTGEALGLDPRAVLVSSTGVIGQYLPIEKICAGIRTAAASLNADGGRDAAEAIRTTDTFTKEIAVRAVVAGVPVVIGGMAKGSGMIAPNMATMLAFVTTDAAVAPELLDRTLREVVDRSFNRISVDGETSTNDMVALLANGQSGNPVLKTSADDGYAAFREALEHVLVKLSKMIVVDGEGATKFVEINVQGAADEQTAVRAARAVANSALVKTALNGEDANWGRILAALGYSGIEFDPAAVEIHFGDLPVLRKNYRIDFSEERAKDILSRREITITIGLHQGEAAASFWTCDLSKEYVAINANYRT
jgi:glutamate N-acetyltransferase / amino-acid N-acetyltransferase